MFYEQHAVGQLYILKKVFRQEHCIAKSRIGTVISVDHHSSVLPVKVAYGEGDDNWEWPRDYQVKPLRELEVMTPRAFNRLRAALSEKQLVRLVEQLHREKQNGNMELRAFRDNPSDLIKSVFVWEDTKYGKDFWEKVLKRFGEKNGTKS